MNLASRILSFVALLGSLVSGLPPAAQAGSCQTVQPETAFHSSCPGSMKGGACCCKTEKAKKPSCHQAKTLSSKAKNCQCLISGASPTAEKTTPTLEKPQAHDVAILAEPLLVSHQIPLAAKASFVQDSPRIRGPDPSSVHLRAPPIC